ncbi:unnamed protein product [Choristocarpus tenellus]
MGAARSQLAKAGLGDEYWFFTITDVAFKTGGMPHEYLGGETPCERLTGKSFNYDRLQAWGSEYYVHQDNSEFHPHAKRGGMMGHDCASLCWHIWLPQEAKLVTSAHVTFEPDEHIMDFVGERETMTSTDDEEISDSEDDSDRDFDIEVNPIPQATAVGNNSTSSSSGQRRSARIAEQPRVDYRGLHSGDTEQLGENIVNLLRSSTDDAYCLMGMAGDISIDHQEPSTIAEALAGPDAEHWKKAMEQEMEGQRTKATFHEGENLPPGRPVKTRFIFKIKRTAHRDIERYKARLVARGFSQQEGVDYFSTFGPVVGFDVIRAVLATAANRNWIINSLDFTQAYLNVPLLEDVWLQLPNGSIVKAARAIYGLMQSAMEWYKELKGTI